MMQNQAILAGIRALVAQIDQLERQNALKASQGLSVGTMSGFGPAAHLGATAVSAPRYVAASGRVSRANSQSKAVAIAERLGVSNRNLHHVAQAAGSSRRYAN
jgi:hypothetical protein